jgi:hypothetical protein
VKLLCVYDPAVILPVHHDWCAVMTARDAFEEHNAAQDFFGFKVAISEMLQLALAGVRDGTPATAGGMAITLLGYLTGPERSQRFLFVVLDDTTPSFSPQGDVLSPHSLDQDIQDIYGDLTQMLGWLEQNHPGKIRYASWRDGRLRERCVRELVGAEGERIPIVRSRYDWCEAYQQLRAPPASLLPNAFLPLPANRSVFAFCPPEGFLEDEMQLPRSRLPERPGWRRIGGNPRGYEDRWGNFWMWNPGREHWDVQITERMRRVVGASDHHLNVECAGRRAPSDNALLEGHIVEGHRPDPETLSCFSIVTSNQAYRSI